MVYFRIFPRGLVSSDQKPQNPLSAPGSAVPCSEAEESVIRRDLTRKESNTGHSSA